MRFLGSTWITLCAMSAPVFAAQAPANPTGAFRQHCFACHGKAAAGGINLEQLTANTSMGEHFQQWQKVATALEQKRMPPAKMPQLSDEQRLSAVNWIRGSLKEHARRTAGDPGRVTTRRLTSGEYAYTVRDLTGLDFKLERDFVSDSVGGEGFTNFGDVQFLDDANLERYLAMTKIIAAATHPVMVGMALERLNSAPISQVIVTDTIPNGDRLSPIRGKLKQLTVARLLGEAAHRIHHDMSVSALFRREAGPVVARAT